MITGTFQLYRLIEYTGNYSNFSPISINIVARVPFLSKFSLFLFSVSIRFNEPKPPFILFIFPFLGEKFSFSRRFPLTSCVSTVLLESADCVPRWGGLRARHISMGDGVDFKLVTSGFSTFPGLRSRRDRASCYPASRYSWSLSAVSSGLTAKTWEDLLRNLSPPLKIYYQPLVSSNSSLLLRTPMQCSAFWSLLSQSSPNLFHLDNEG